jgi:hypothetical protein
VPPLKRAGGCAVPHRSLDGSRPWAQQRNYLYLCTVCTVHTYFSVHSFPTAACRFVNHRRSATQRNLDPPPPGPVCSLSQPSGEGGNRWCKGCPGLLASRLVMCRVSLRKTQETCSVLYSSILDVGSWIVSLRKMFGLHDATLQGLGERQSFHIVD